MHVLCVLRGAAAAAAVSQAGRLQVRKGPAAVAAAPCVEGGYRCGMAALSVANGAVTAEVDVSARGIVRVAVGGGVVAAVLVGVAGARKPRDGVECVGSSCCGACGVLCGVVRKVDACLQTRLPCGDRGDTFNNCSGRARAALTVTTRAIAVNSSMSLAGGSAAVVSSSGAGLLRPHSTHSTQHGCCAMGGRAHRVTWQSMPCVCCSVVWTEG